MAHAEANGSEGELLLGASDRIELIATIVTPRDCSRCHKVEGEEFARSHHAQGGNILASLDNFLAETVEGSRTPFNPHSPTPGRDVDMVNGMASAQTGCKQCHGDKVALEATDGTLITVDQLKPGSDGKPTDRDSLAKIKKASNGRPILSPTSWPNTGIGRINLDGSLGSCSACHSRHDFSPRRARQPEDGCPTGRGRGAGPRARNAGERACTSMCRKNGTTHIASSVGKRG